MCTIGYKGLITMNIYVSDAQFCTQKSLSQHPGYGICSKFLWALLATYCTTSLWCILKGGGHAKIIFYICVFLVV